MTAPRVAVWRHTLLPASETFIDLQTRNLDRYRAVLMGRERGRMTATSPARVIDSPWAAAERVLYTATGLSPRLARHLRAVNPRVIHAHFGVEGSYALQYAKAARVPLVTTFHGFDATRSFDALARGKRPAHYYYMAHHGQLRRQGTLFLAVSGFIRDRVLERGFDPDRVHVHHIGVEVPHTVVPWEARTPHTLFAVGRLVPKKGFVYLIRAMHELRERLPALTLRIAGEGPERARLEREIQRYDLADRVTLLGHTPHADVLAEMAQAQLFVSPSITDDQGETEGLPTVIMEAGARGVASVASKSGGTEEAIAQGRSGLIVEPRRPAALAAAIYRMVGPEQLAAPLGRGARARVEMMFDVKRQCCALEDLYDDAVQRHAM